MKLNKKFIKKMEGDKRVSIALMCTYVVLSIQYMILISFNLLDTNTGNLIQVFSKIIGGAAFLYAFPVVFHRSKKYFFISYYISFVTILVNYLIFPENSGYIESYLFEIFFLSLPCLIYSMSIKNIIVFKNVVSKSAFVVFIFGIFTTISIFFGFSEVFASYSMAFSYYMLLPLIVYLDKTFDDGNITHLIICLTSLTIIVLLGARGPIIGMVVFILLKFLRMRPNKNYKSLAIYSAIITSLFFSILFFKNIIQYIYEFLLKYGIKSRSLQLFFREGLYFSGRDDIYSRAIEVIHNFPLIGAGIGGDRRLLGVFVHNFFLEVIINFGIILGTFLICVILIIIFKGLLVKNTLMYNIFIIWLSLGFMHLMVSSSYIRDFRFWIFLGLSINILFNQNKNRY